MTFGFVFAILLEGFTKLQISDNSEEQPNHIEEEEEEDGECHLTSNQSLHQEEKEPSKLQINFEQIQLDELASREIKKYDTESLRGKKSRNIMNDSN